MNWNFISFFKKNRAPKPSLTNLDHKLVNKTRTNILPNFKQIKYLNRFLSRTEKITLLVAGAVFVLMVIGWIVLFLFNHAGSAPAFGGEYKEATFIQPKFINPLFASASETDTDLSSLVYSGLFRINKEQKLIPDLAENFTISEDGKTYHIKLKEKIKWSDGEPITADDVLFTFDAIQNNEVNSPLFTSFQGVQVERIDDYQVDFTLKEPFSPFLTTLTIGIIPRHVWSEVAPESMKLAKNNLQPVGSGVWKFSKLTKDDNGNIQSYVLEQNDNYYGTKPYLQTLMFKFYPDYNRAVEAIKAQDITAINFLPREQIDKIATKSFNIFNFELPQYTALFFNQEESDLLTEDDLRQALSLAVDKEKLIKESSLANNASIVQSFFLPGYIGYDASLIETSTDTNTANKLLDKKWKQITPEEYYKIRYAEILKTRQIEIDEAKKTSASSTISASTTIEKIEKETTDMVRGEMSANQIFYRKDKKDNLLKLSITTIDTPEYKSVANAIIKMWQTVGAQCDLKLVENFQFNKEVLKGRNYEILLYGEIIGIDPDPYPFWHSSQTSYPGLNLALYSNREADKLIESARATSSPSARDELYKKFQKIILKDRPAIFLYTPSYNFVVDKEIKGVDVRQIYLPQDRYADIGNWYINIKKTWIK